MSEVRKIHPTDIFLSYEIRDKIVNEIVPKIRKWHAVLKAEDKKRDIFKASKSSSLQRIAFTPMTHPTFAKWKSLAQAGAFVCSHTISQNDIGDRDKFSRYINKKMYPSKDYDQVRTFVELAFDARKDCARMLKEVQTMIGDAILITNKYKKYKDSIVGSGIIPSNAEVASLAITEEMKEAFIE